METSKIQMIKMCIFALLGFLLYNCDSDVELAKKQTKTLSYNRVIKQMVQSGYHKVDSKGIDLNHLLSPNYIEYSVFQNPQTNSYFVPVCYDKNEQNIVENAMSECDQDYIEVTRNGIKYMSCQERGNTCHNEISFDEDGNIDISIIVCTNQDNQN